MTRILHPAEITCLIGGPASSSHVVMLVGNSHADAIKTVFARVAAANGIAVYFAVENNPLMGGRIDAEHLVWEAAARKADAIVLHYSPGAISPSVVEQVAVLAGQHNVRVLFVMPVPVWKKQVPQMLWAAARYGQPVQHLSIIDYQRANAELARSLATIRSPNFSVYQVADAFCTPDCVLTDEGKPLYFDKEHLTLTGSEKLTGVFSKIMSDILSASSSEHECQQEAPRQPSDARGLAGSPAGACTS